MFKGKSVMSLWLILQNNLNIGIPYHKRPVGNSPESMPPDSSLNNDVQSRYLHHCTVTSHLNDNDIRKHSVKTPRSIETGITRIWEHQSGPPNRQCIFHDCLHVITAMKKVYDAKGSIVEGLSNRNGIRYSASGT